MHGTLGEAWSSEAGALTASLIDGATVVLRLEPQRRRGVFGRVLAHVELPDGSTLNERLLAEGFARKLTPAGCSVYSAGSIPTTVHPIAVAVMAEVGVDLSDHFSKSLDDIPLDRIGTVITLCEEEVCPAVPGVVERLHWGFPDPAGHDESDEERLARFRAVRDEIEIRLREWLDG